MIDRQPSSCRFRETSALRGTNPALYRSVLIVFLAATLLASSACNRTAKLPDKSSKEYADVVSAFYVGLRRCRLAMTCTPKADSRR